MVFDDLIRGSQTVNTAAMSDPVLIRADGSYLYTLTSVADDIALGITDVIRAAKDHVCSRTPARRSKSSEALGATVRRASGTTIC